MEERRTGALNDGQDIAQAGVGGLPQERDVEDGNNAEEDHGRCCKHHKGGDKGPAVGPPPHRGWGHGGVAVAAAGELAMEEVGGWVGGMGNRAVQVRKPRFFGGGGGGQGHDG